MAGFENVFVILIVFAGMGIFAVAACWLGIRIVFAILRAIVSVVNAVWSAVFSPVGALVAVSVVVFFMM